MFKSHLKPEKLLFGINCNINKEEDSEMNELVSRVQAASANQPGWLRKKRQLAAMLLTRFSTTPEEQPLVDAWQKSLDTHLVAEQEPATSAGLVDLPLLTAVKQYPAMCQENLMEKGLSW